MPKTITKKRAKSIYSVHPTVVMMQTWITELPQKTGRSLEQWIKLVRQEGPPDDKARRDWLKRQHGMGGNSAGWLADRAGSGGVGGADKGITEDDPDSYLKAAEQYVENMFAGGKAALRPIYDRLLQIGLKIGPEARACPCQTIVPLYRNHVFAQIKPTTNTRIDFGLALGPLMKQGKKVPARLIDTGGFAKKDRITHRILITALKDIDDEVKRWLKTAYDLDQ